MQALVVVAHPCDDSFAHALADRARAGLVAAGHDVDVLDLYREQIDPVMRADEWRAYLAHLTDTTSAADAWVDDHARRVAAAEILVVVYPTWWSSMPAILKGWLERTMRPGVAFTIDERGSIDRGLRNLRHVVGISTYGSSWWYVKLVNDNGRRVIQRALRACATGRTRSIWMPLYSIDTSTPARRQHFLQRVHDRMASL